MNVQTKEVAGKLERHLESVSPGMPLHLNGANSVGDVIAQGDLYIEVWDGSIPKGYERVENPTEADMKLVPGGLQGSHHMLESLEGVTLYRPTDWGQREEDLRGPIVVFSSKNAIVHRPGTNHPHGTVYIDDPMSVNCTYQRNLAADEAAERRAAD